MLMLIDALLVPKGEASKAFSAHLVSWGCLDMAGFTMEAGDHLVRIRDPRQGFVGDFMEIEDLGGCGTGLYYMTCALVDMTTRAFSNIWGEYYESMRAAADKRGKRVVEPKILLCEAKANMEMLGLEKLVSEVVLEHGCVHGFMGERMDVGVHLLKDERFERVKARDRVAGVDQISVQQLHLRLGHAIPVEEARRALLAGAFRGISLREAGNNAHGSKCMGCALGGMRRGPLNPQSEGLKERMNAPLSENKWKGRAVHGSADTFGLVPVKGVSGERYVFGCVVNYPYTFAFPYPIVDKDSATCDKYFAQTRALLHAWGLDLVHVRTDGGSEFAGKFQKIPEPGPDGKRDYDPVHMSKSVPGNQQQNGGAEGSWNIFMQPTRKMMEASGLPMKFWPFAVKYAGHCSRVRLVERETYTAYEAYSGKKPDLKKYRPFGALVITRNLSPDHKLAPRGLMGVSRTGGGRYLRMAVRESQDYQGATSPCVSKAFFRRKRPGAGACEADNVGMDEIRSCGCRV